MTEDGSLRTMQPPHRVVATAGHVDHGKSTLVRALTGMEPDRFAEERRRGLTLDLGFVWTQLGEHGTDAPVIAFVDVPGHERFVSTMLAGAGAAPAALLVVAADDGWSRQSSEHRDVLDLLGVPGVAVVITKAEAVDAERLAQVRADIAAELTDTMLEDAPVVVTDAVAGRGLDELRGVLRERLDQLPLPADVGRPRLWVDRAFSVTGAGTVVTGTLTHGWLARGADVLVLPAGRRARLRGLQALGVDVEAAPPGTRVACNLAGIDHTEVARGDVVVTGAPWRVAGEADLLLRVLPGRTVARPGAWHLHIGSAHTTCTMLPLDGPIQGGAATGDAVTGIVRVVLHRPLTLVAGDRVVLRDAGPQLTVAGGVVVDPAPARRPRGRDQRAQRATALREVAAAGTPAARVHALLAVRGGSAVRDTTFAAAGLPTDAALPEGIAALGDHLAAETVIDVWREAVRALGPGTHDAHTVAAAARDAAPHEVPAQQLAEHLVADGTLVRLPGGLAVAEHAAAVDTARLRRAAELRAALLDTPLAPPDVDAAARELGLDHRDLAALVRDGAVVRCGDVAFAREAIEQAVAAVRDLAAQRPDGFTAAEAKRTWGTTRRYAIPLLEHLDRIGVTTFDGQLRRLR